MKDSIISHIKYTLYKAIYGTYYKYVLYIKTRKFRKSLNIMNSVDTIEYIREHKCSTSRFGDGELRMVEYYMRNGSEADFNVDTFQSYNPEIGRRLTEVLLSNDSRCLICMPYVFIKQSTYRGYERFHFLREYAYYQTLWKHIGSTIAGRLLGDCSFTRFYFHRADIKDYKKYIKNLKSLWDGQDIIFIEGDKSRLGVGNDLFDNARSIKRYLMPSTNAFERYDEILEVVKTLPKDSLYLLALGHTATILAYDMTLLGYRAIDIGHIDIEYEWMLMGAKEKLPVKNKYVNEVMEGRIDTDLNDQTYLSQIIGRL